MNILKTSIPDLVLLEPQVFGDDRGYFLETFSAKHYQQVSISEIFVQDNESFSRQGILRGLHYQLKKPQGKLVRVCQGEVFDVAVDIRLGSPTFGQWCGVHLSGQNKHQFYVPPGFAHGFCVLSETATFLYKCTDYYSPGDEYGIIWNDPDLSIEWPLDVEPLLSQKDAVLPKLKTLDESLLTQYFVMSS